MTQNFVKTQKWPIFAVAMGKNYTFVRGAAFPYQYKYEHPAVTTDCVIFTYEDWKLKVLLVRRGGEPYKGEWALPGGFLRNDETAKDGALRELREETGLAAAAIGELGVFSDPGRDPRERVITIAFYALVKPSEVVGGDDADACACEEVVDVVGIVSETEPLGRCGSRIAAHRNPRADVAVFAFENGSTGIGQR